MSLHKIVEYHAFNSISNVVLILAYSWFLYNHITGILIGTLSSVSYIFIVMETTVLSLILLRSKPKIRSHDPIAWLCAFIGTILPLFLQPTNYVLNETVGSTLMVTGGILATLAYLSLNKSFGISPALRSVKINGLYKFIRHPMYASYLIVYLGYIQLSFSWINVIILVFAILFLVIRIYFEEKILITDESYRKYSHEVQYRLLPFVF